MVEKIVARLERSNRFFSLPTLLARKSTGGNARFASLLTLDLTVALFAVYGALLIAGGRGRGPVELIEFVVLGALLFATAISFIFLGLYRSLIRHMGQQAVWDLARAVTLSALSLVALVHFADLNFSASAPILFWLILFVGSGATRMMMRTWHQASLGRDARRVIIYGAGESGRQLLHALNHGASYQVVAFVDDDPSVVNSVIAGRPVLSADQLESLIVEFDVAQVLLAVPSATHERRREIINSLVGMPVHVRTVPKISELVAGRASVNQIQDVDLDDLLGRDPVPPHPELIDRCISGKVVMVTGAGGSIGAELCRQIIESEPSDLLLLDTSEFSLYRVERELRTIQSKLGLRTTLVTLLGTVRDEERLRALFSTFKVDTVYHAAAYKHVPMVEHNIAEGVANNVQGTLNAARAAQRAGVDTFVLISTDKAVRPANVMGASKRFAELILQGMSQLETPTRFCIVRFGNVLGSSGSVVPLFREQIEQGGPVTVTHPEVSRYFMSIREAAQLVLQAGSMGTGGDVFVLDMGEPIRIVDLARRMIRLSGYELEGEASDCEHIDIDFIGLRPGEKLHEELLLGTSVTGTGHPMIMRAEESSVPLEEIEIAADRLIEACHQVDCGAVTSILKDYVVGFEGHEPWYDFIWVKQGRVGKRPRARSSAENVASFPTQERMKN